MSRPSAFDADKFQKGFLIAFALGISLLFLAMIRDFLIALLLAAILSGLVHPFYRRLLRRFRGRKALASAATVTLVLMALIVPATALLGLVTAQAVQMSQAIRPWVAEQLRQPNALDALADRLPFLQTLRPHRETILEKMGELANWVGTFVVTAIADTARGTVTFLFLLLVMLYALFFFLIDGKSLLNKILYYMPLHAEDEDLMVGKFVSVTRATVKGTLVIGVLQGALAGIAFWVVGIKGAVFWGTVMAVLSIVPAVGASLVWVPAAIYLYATGHVSATIALVIWCGALVGTMDNFLRPWLVGKDTKMPDLLILLSTLGGLTAFGAIGIIIGPIVAALFVTIWDIYGAAFRGILPEGPGQPPPQPNVELKAKP